MEKPTQGRLFTEQDLADEQSDRRVVINERCQLLISGDDRIVMVLGVVVGHFRVGDRVSEAYAMVSLLELGHAQQNEVAQAFGCSARSVRRYLENFTKGGLAALGRPTGYPVGRPRLPEARVKMIEKLKANGHSNRAIARRMGVDEKAIRKLLKRRGWKSQEGALQGLDIEAGADLNISEANEEDRMGGQSNICIEACLVDEPVASIADFNMAIPPKEAQESALSFSLDTDPLNRVNDRFLASQGLLDDALPLFASGKAIPGAGVLLAVPILMAAGVLTCAANIYGSMGSAFHGLRTTIMTFLLMALLRIKRPEELKEHSPQTLDAYWVLTAQWKRKPFVESLHSWRQPGVRLNLGMH